MKKATRRSREGCLKDLGKDLAGVFGSPRVIQRIFPVKSWSISSFRREQMQQRTWMSYIMYTETVVPFRKVQNLTTYLENKIRKIQMKNKSTHFEYRSVHSKHLGVSKKLITIILTFLIVLVVPPAFSQSKEDTTDWRFHDDLLNKLAGKWELSGRAHGMKTKLILQADWVLNHQYLRIYEKSDINVPGINVPYEEYLFIGYDKGYYDSVKHYVAHFMSIAGGDVSQDPVCSRTGNQLKLEFKGKWRWHRKADLGS
jgi:hypothetical protein